MRFLFFATLSVILLLQLRGFDETLRTDATPAGIVGYEFAWSEAGAERYLDAWRNTEAMETAKVSLGVDFAFLLAYPLMFVTGIALLRRAGSATAFDRTGAILQRAVLLCIPLDATENVLLWRMLDHGASNSQAHLATLCAGIKFLLVIAAAGWCLAALARRFGMRQSTS